MILTTEQIREILKIIRLHHHAFVYSNVTKDVSPEILDQLFKEGIIQPGQNTNNLFKDAYEIERLRTVIEDAKRNNLTLDEAKRRLFQNPIRLSALEQSTIEHIEQSAGQYITKQSDLLSERFEEGIRNENMAFKQKIIGDTIKTPLKQAVEKRKTISQIVSDLRNASDDIYRDFHRVAFTEMQNARMHGKLDQIYRVNEGKEESEVLVFKRPNPDGCPKCKSAYLESDGVTPKVFKLSEFRKNISNFGIKVKKWMPTLEALHPYCACEMSQLQPGFGFDEDGELKFVGEKKTPKPQAPQPVAKNLHLYDSKGNLKKSKVVEMIKKSVHYDKIADELKKTGKTKFKVKDLILILKKFDK